MGELLLTYDELAERLGLKRNAARVLAQRRKWPRMMGNDGRARVRVPDDDIVPRGRSHMRPPDPDVVPSSAPRDAVIAHIEARLADTLAEVARLRADLDRERADADAARGHARDLVGSARDLAGKLALLHQQRLTEMTEAARLRHELDKARDELRRRRGLWQRIFGW